MPNAQEVAVEEQTDYQITRELDYVLLHHNGRTAGLLFSKHSLYILDTLEELTAEQPLQVITPLAPRRYSSYSTHSSTSSIQAKVTRSDVTLEKERLRLAFKSPIRVLVFYAENWWEPGTDHIFFTNLLEVIANWAFWRNKINLRVQLIPLTVSGRRSTSTEKDLDDLEANLIEPTRLCAFVESEPAPHVIAWIGNYPPETAGKARPCNGLLLPWGCPSYVVADARFALEQFGLLHELGHLLGLDHEPGGGTSGCKVSPEARAYVSVENHWHTIMGDPPRTLRERRPILARMLSYVPFVGPRLGSVALPLWSSPDLKYLNETAGSETQNNRAQLARILAALPVSRGS